MVVVVSCTPATQQTCRWRTQSSSQVVGGGISAHCCCEPEGRPSWHFFSSAVFCFSSAAILAGYATASAEGCPFTGACCCLSTASGWEERGAARLQRRWGNWRFACINTETQAAWPVDSKSHPLLYMALTQSVNLDKYWLFIKMWMCGILHTALQKLNTFFWTLKIQPNYFTWGFIEQDNIQSR